MTLAPELLADLRKKAEDAKRTDGGTWALLHDEAGPRYIMDGTTPVAGVHTCSMEAARHMAMADPDTVLALLGRIDALEKDMAEALKALGHAYQQQDALQDMRTRIAGLEQRYVLPSSWRCDGCGGREATEDGRRPDRHDGCGGMWIRQ